MSTAMDEKQPVEMAASGLSNAPKTSDWPAADETPIDPKAERRLLLKLDLVIFPVFFVIYMMCFLDRINISNARIQGMAEELELVGNRFNIALFVRRRRSIR